jgi:hypothetical protein
VIAEEPLVNRHVLTSGLTAALAAFAFLPAGCSEEAGTRQQVSEEAPTRNSTPGPGRGPSDWIPIPADSDEPLPAGRLGMTANGRPDVPWAVVEVPENFSTIGGWVIFDEDPKGGGGVGYWTVSEVVRNPCLEYGAANAIDAGDTVEEFLAALQRQRLTRITAPVPVAVDGYHGVSLELHLPKDADFATCPDYNVWESDPAGARHFGERGEFDKVWILDVEGEVVVLSVTSFPGVPKSALGRLSGMVEAAEFIPRS